jgi:hypothetical protein
MTKLDLDDLESKARVEDDQRWLFSQFQAACATLRERSSYRRGPFLVYESDLPIASSAHKATMLALIAHIRELKAENEALSVKQTKLVEALKPLVDAAYGLSFGEDWNNGTEAKLHGNRRKLITAIPNARAALSRVNE